MTTPRSAADEARDPGTSPDRLLELTRKHPQLQGLIVTNPSCPDVAKDWILATNPWAKDLYEQQQSSAAGTPLDADPEDPEAVSVWGDIFEAPAAPAPQPPAAQPPAEQPPAEQRPAEQRPAEQRPAEQSPSVQVASDSGVVPLGPAGPPAVPGAGATPITAVPPAGRPEREDDGRGGRRWIWLVGGGCLLLAIVLLIAAVLGASALLSGDDDEYQRPTSDPATEQTEQSAPEEETTEDEPEQDPVSPAPEGAVEMDSLSSPTGNITCSLEGDAVGCSVADRDFSEAGLEDCSDGPFSLQVADGEASSACGQTFAGESAPTLEYGDSAVSGDVACTSEFDGMTCWNTQTGQGFFVNRVTYETF